MDIVLNSRPVGITERILWTAKCTNAIIVSKNPSLLEKKAESLGITGLKIVPINKEARGRFCNSIIFDIHEKM